MGAGTGYTQNIHTQGSKTMSSIMMAVTSGTLTVFIRQPHKDSGTMRDSSSLFILR